MTFIESDRLILRNVTSNEADTMYEYRNKETCARYQWGKVNDHNG